jgi:hypothetical protein
MLSLSELLERLNERFTYLIGGPVDAPERRQTLRATLDWSYELLPDRARKVLGALSVFHGGFTLQAAQVVCAPAATSDSELLEALGTLVNHAGVLSEQALALSRHVDPISRLTIRCLRSVAEVRLGRESDAIATVRDAIHGVSVLDLPPVSVSEWLRTCAIVATRAGNAERAARLFGHNEVLRERNETSLDPTEVRELRDALEILDAKLYPEVLSSAWQHGRSMSTTEALAEVHKEFDPPEHRAGNATTFGL